MNRRPITEDDLQAFVDNALEAERRREVADYLATNAEAAARVQAYERHSAALRAALDPVADEPVPTRLNLATIAAGRPRAPRPSYLRMAAAATVLLAIGATGGWMTRSAMLAPTEGVAALAQEASASFDAYASDTVRPVEFRADGGDALRQIASQTLGAATVIPDLSGAGYRLMGGRIIPTVHGRGFMLMYDNDKGSRLVVLSRRMQADQNKPMVPMTEGAVAGWSWARNGMGVSLVGSMPADELHQIANALRSQV